MCRNFPCIRSKQMMLDRVSAGRKTSILARMVLQAAKGRPVGDRTRGFLTAILNGATETIRPIEVYLSGYITENELDKIHPHLPERTHLDARAPNAMSFGSLINETFPVVGVCDPLGVMANTERLRNPAVSTVFIGLRAMYDRGFETVDTSAQLIDLITDSLDAPYAGLWQRMERLRQICGRWGGPERADRLFEAFVNLNNALRIKGAAAGSLGTYSGGVTQRWITRPLMIKPDLLTPDEEAYFLPYIFNIHEHEARHDYIDLAGSRLVPDSLPPTRADARIPAIRTVVTALRQAAQTFSEASDGPEGAWLKRLSLSLTLWTNMLLSSNNFYGAQLIRDRCRDILSGPPRIPSKEPTWTGDPNLLAFNEMRREEYDNAIELVELLENGGLDLVVRVATTREADAFTLEPELIAHVRRKIEIIRAHWLDGEKYLTTPFI